MSKYREVFDARKQESQKKTESHIKPSENLKNVNLGNPEVTKSGNMEIQTQNPSHRLVNLGIKVAESRRRHWGAKAKLEGVTISEVIIDALSKKFGEPE